MTFGKEEFERVLPTVLEPFQTVKINRLAHRGVHPTDVDDKLPSQSLVTSQDGDFSNIRDYKVGDPMQRIAWKQSARTDDLKVLELETEQGVSCWLNWDSLMGLDTERRLSRLTAWVVQAENEGWLYGLNIPGKKIAPSSGQGHYLECLKALALWGHNES